MLPNVVLFEGEDAGASANLWETDGTAAGTFELIDVPSPPPPIMGEATFGFAPNSTVSLDLTVFNDQVLFIGRVGPGSVGPYELWTTDGTAIGTVPLVVAGADSTGLFSTTVASGALPLTPGFTVFGDQVLFRGLDSAGVAGLWATDGTAGGTKEITGINGVGSTGINPTDLTVFNSKVLFNGADTAGNFGLWTTDGTAGATQELTPIGGAAATGLDPSDMTVFNSEVLFNGVDVNGLHGLWVTNGTAGGTHELTAGAGGASDPSGLNPTDLTVFNGEVLFGGVDATGDTGLWVTNGTTTTELTGITGANAAGISPSDFTLFNGKVVFRGLNSSGQWQVWETDGTVGGTHVLLPATALLAPSANPASHLEVYNNLLLFQGANRGLWATDGTSAGTVEITPSSGVWQFGLRPADLTSLTSTVTQGPELVAGGSVSYVAGAPSVALDPGLSISDPESGTLVGATVSIGAGFREGDALSVGSPQAGITSSYNAGTGVLTLSGAASLAAYQAALDSVAFTTASATNPSRTITWSVKDGAHTSPLASSSVSVFTNNSGSDITLQNANGQLALWQVNGTTLSASGLLSPNPGPNWLDMGTGAFFSGDTSDILLQNTNGSVAVWQEQGAALVSSHVLASPGPSWRVDGTGDFNNDGKSDIVLQNSNGNVAVWETNGGGAISQSAVVANPGPSWQVEGTGDFNNDSKSDIVLQNSNGNVAVWDMDGDHLSQSATVANPGANWHVVGTGDLYGDGKSDIVLQNTNGNVAVWEVTGSTISKSGVIANPGPNWHVAATGDFNLDGKTDLVLHNNSGAVAVWDMNGSAISHSGLLASPGPAWSVIGDGRHIG